MEKEIKTRKDLEEEIKAQLVLLDPAMGKKAAEHLAKKWLRLASRTKDLVCPAYKEDELGGCKYDDCGECDLEGEKQCCCMRRSELV